MNAQPSGQTVLAWALLPMVCVYVKRSHDLMTVALLPLSPVLGKSLTSVPWVLGLTYQLCPHPGIQPTAQARVFTLNVPDSLAKWQMVDFMQ